MDVAGLQEEGGAGKQMKEGWGLMGVHVGIWGWATVEHPPRYCLLCQAESVFFQEAWANLSTSTNTLHLDRPDTPPPPTVGAFLFVHRGMEVCKAHMRLQNRLLECKWSCYCYCYRCMFLFSTKHFCALKSGNSFYCRVYSSSDALTPLIYFPCWFQTVSLEQFHKTTWSTKLLSHYSTFSKLASKPFNPLTICRLCLGKFIQTRIIYRNSHWNVHLETEHLQL